MAPDLITLRTELIGASPYSASPGALFDVDLTPLPSRSQRRIAAELASDTPELEHLGPTPPLLPTLASLADAMLDALGLAFGPCTCGAEGAGGWLHIAAFRIDIARAVARGLERALRASRPARPAAIAAALGATLELWEDESPTRELFCAARKAGIPARFMSEDRDTLLLGTGARRRVSHQDSLVSSTGLDAVVEDKLATARWLSQAGIPCTNPRWVGSRTQAIVAARSLGYPVVVKPAHSARQVGVFTNLRTDADVAFAFRRASASAGLYHGSVLVETYNAGRYARATMIGGELEALIVSTTPTVRADGRSTMLALAKKQLGLEPRDRIEDRGVVMLEGVLRQQGLTFQSVPAKGRRVAIGLSNHGPLRDVTSRAHRSLRAILRRVAQLFPLPALGIDLLMRAPTGTFNPATDVVLEVNTRPSLLMGNPRRDVMGALVRHLFPEGPRGASVPAVAASLAQTGDLIELARAVESKGVATAGYARGVTWSRAVKTVVGRGVSSARLIAADSEAQVIFMVVDDDLLRHVGVPVPEIDYLLSGGRKETAELVSLAPRATRMSGRPLLAALLEDVERRK